MEIATDEDSPPTAGVTAARSILAETRGWVEVAELRHRFDAIERMQRPGGDLDTELRGAALDLEGG